MNFLSGNHLGSFLGDDATGGSADPNSPVITLSTDSTALPTVPPAPLATSDAQPVPTTPSSPMQFTSPEPLAVVDPGLPPPTVLTPTVVVPPAPSFFAQNKALVIGGALLAAYLMFGKGGSSAPAKSRGKARGKSRGKRRYSGRRKFHARR